MINPVLDSYFVGLVLGAGFSGIVASLFSLHSNLAMSLKESLLSDE